MKIENPTGDPDCHRSQYSVRFEERDLKTLRLDYPREAFERIRRVSEINDRLYQTFVSPWVREMVNPWTAEAMKWLHPMRISRYFLGIFQSLDARRRRSSRGSGQEQDATAGRSPTSRGRKESDRTRIASDRTGHELARCSGGASLRLHLRTVN